MRINRHKKVTKYLNFYKNNFQFRKPFQVLIDGTFCYAALKNKVNVQDQLRTYLGTDVKLLTTKCVIIETEKLGKQLHGAMLITKQFGLHHCGHDKPISGSQCFVSMVGKENTNRYIVATQDRDLQDNARFVPGTPILYLHQKTPTLEQPSAVSVKTAKEKTDARFSLTSFDEENITQLKTAEFGPQKEEKKKRKRKGGPNPLSCLKSKRKPQGESNLKSENKRKRKRIRLKLPDHVKTELSRSQSL